MTSSVLAAVRAQIEAALCTMRACITLCPDDLWNSGWNDEIFCQVAFHALFFADVAFGNTTGDDLRKQQFHIENPDIFRDYEELEYRLPVHRYTRDQLTRYAAHCLRRVAEVVPAQTERDLEAPVAFPWLNKSRIEHYIETARHLQHHAAQLSLRLQEAGIQSARWYESGCAD